MFWQLALAAAAVFALYYSWSRRRLYRLAAEIPSGLKWYPIIGHAYKSFGSNEDRMKTLQEFGRIANQQGGLSSFWMANKLFICVTDPNTIEMVMKECLDKPEQIVKHTRMVIGNGSIFAPVNIWHPRRKVNAPFFSMKALNHLVPVFDKKSTVMADLMRAEAGRGDFPAWNYFTEFTFDTVCETAVGTKIDSQGKSEHEVLHAIDGMLQMVAKRILQPWLYPDLVYKNLPVYKKFLYTKNRMCDFVDEIIRKKRIELAAIQQNEGVSNKAQRNFLDVIIQPSGANEKGYSDMELREEILVMILAGNDTSAVGASFATVLLSRYPDVQEKVYQELREVFGESDRAVTAEDLSRLKYLEAVIKESLRLYPPASGTTLVDGTNILINIWGTHRNPLYWGADADLFRPERFLRGALPHPAMFIPFSYSVRGCIVNIWHPRRKVNAPFFSMKALNHLVPVFDKKSTVMADLMRAEAGRGDFPAWNYFTEFTFDTVCETAVGTKIDSQGKSEHEVLHAIDGMLQMVAKRILQPWLYPDLVYKNLPVYKKFLYTKNRMCDFVDEIIRKKRIELAAIQQNEGVSNKAQRNFLDVIIQPSGANEKGYSDMELREEILVMILAGNDTSAVGASFATVLLSRYPDVQEKVYQELREVFGESDRAVTAEDLSRLKYLEAVIKESLRLYPPGPVVIRVASGDVVLRKILIYK